MKPHVRPFRSRRVALLVVSSLFVELIPVLPASAASRPSDPLEQVRVNKTPPRVSPPSGRMTLSADADTDEISRARVFGEPLVPVGGAPTAQDNRALSAAIRAYAAAGGGERVEAFVAFLDRAPSSPWRASLLANLGVVYRQTGHFSRALDVWHQAWSLAKDGIDPKERAVADLAIGELLELYSRLGRFDMLEQLIAEADTRELRGSANQKVSAARQALWMMNNEPENAFRCGPLALDSLLRSGNPAYVTPEPIQLCASTRRGTSLLLLRDVATAAGAPMVVAFRPPGAEIALPAVVHWRVGHYAAAMARRGDLVLIRDPTFGGDLWVSTKTLDEELSGYFLVPGRTAQPGWRQVPDEEAGEVWGKGIAAAGDDTDMNDNHPRCPTCGGGGAPPPSGPPPGGFGMASVSIQMMLISVTVDDIPIWYSPPRGPVVEFRARYNQRDKFQPQIFTYPNLGPLWTFDWISYIQDDPANPNANVELYMRGAGKERYSNYSPTTGAYGIAIRTQAALRRVSSSPLRYERELTDGSVEVFAQPDGALAYPRRVFMTESRDPHGNSLTFTWDAQFRLVALTDAVGQVTTLRACQEIIDRLGR